MQIAEDVLMYIEPSTDPFEDHTEGLKLVIVRLSDKGTSTYIKVTIDNLPFEPNLLAWNRSEEGLLDS